MKKHFYSHIIEIDSVYTLIDLMEIKKEEKDDLIAIVDSTVHHTILDTVMSELSEHDKKVFLSHLMEQRNDELWKLLETRVKKAEKKIRKAVDDLKQDFHKDIKKVINKKSL